MKYTTEIIIDRPLDKVIQLFDDFENLKKWMPELQSYEHISGEKGAVGAKTRLHYKMGSREVEMIETVTARNLPDEFSVTYEAKGVFNVVRNLFQKVDANSAKWISENEFQFKGFMKIMAYLMPGAFKKQSQKYMQQFKDFAEGS